VPPLLDVDEARPQLDTALDDDALELVIAREEAEMIRLYGPHGDGVTTVVEMREGRRAGSLFLSRPIASVASIVEYSQFGELPSTLLTTDYFVFSSQGRLVRLPVSSVWGAAVVVTYAPADDRPLRQAVLIDLLRLALTRRAASSWTEERHADTVGKTDSMAMTRSWDQERQAILQRLLFIGV
jgi:hypothetical protein